MSKCVVFAWHVKTPKSTAAAECSSWWNFRLLSWWKSDEWHRQSIGASGA